MVKLFQIARIINSKSQLITFSDSLGNFSFDLSIYPIFGVEKKGYQTRWFKMDEEYKTSITITLDYFYQEVGQVVVTEEGAHTVMDIENVNIINYITFCFNNVNYKEKEGWIVWGGKN